MNGSIQLSPNKRKELHRLLKAFEEEAARFHDLRFSVLSVSQEVPEEQIKFDSPHHCVMLWQYYGKLRDDRQVQAFQENIATSDLKFGIRGAEISQFGVLEGQPLQLFLRMAKRAGSLFEGRAAHQIKTRVTDEIQKSHQFSSFAGKPVSVVNDNVLAIWLNYLLYHLSLSGWTRRRERIEPDPFSLSLLALERLEEEGWIGKIDRSSGSIDELKFKVAVSFPGERRAYVAEMVDVLQRSLGKDSVFYDHNYQSQLARPNLDLLLLDLYSNRAELLVVFVCSEYREKAWCGLEWRAIRSLMSTHADRKVMFVRFDDNKIDGLLSIDGYIDARRNSPTRLAGLVMERLQT